MSHFAVLVIGDDVDKALAPFHEFECTGLNDEYVKEVDQTEEALEDYQKDTNKMILCPDGEKICFYDFRFYREPTEEESKEIGHMGGAGAANGLIWASNDWEDGKGYRTKVHFIPEGHEEMEVDTKDVQTFAEFVSDYYGRKLVKHDEKPDVEEDGEHKDGYAQLDENGDVLKVVNRTNPNARWDWFAIGGRWRGYFRVKFPISIRDVVVGDCGGLHDKKPESGYADQLRIKDIDFEGEETKVTEKSTKRFAEWNELLKKHDPDHKTKTWTHFRLLADDEANSMTYDEARDAYNSQPLMKVLSKPEMRDTTFGGFYGCCQVDDMGFDRRKYVNKELDRMFVTFALVKDGEWYEKGKMGWWGMSSDEMEQETWNSKFNELLKGLPEDTIVTLVDCHI